MLNRNCFSAIILLLATFAVVPDNFAHADIAVIVHPQNKLATLTPQQLKKIFLGRMPLFPVSSHEIRAIDLPDDNAVFREFYHQVVELDGTELKRYRAYYLFSGRGRLPDIAQTPEEMIEKVAADTGAIGYVDRNAIDETTTRVLVILPGTAPPAHPPATIKPQEDSKKN